MDSKEDSLRVRYSSKLIANFVGFGVSLLSQAIILRGLGPSLYGDFSFITNFFSQLVGFFDLGSSIAFFSKLSQRPREQKLIFFYMSFCLLMALLVLIFSLGLLFFNWGTVFWPGQQTIFIIAGILWGIMEWYSGVINNICDAHALTVQSEKIRIVQRGISCLLVILMFISGVFSLGKFFIYNYIIFGFLIGMWIRLLHRHGIRIFQHVGLTANEIWQYAVEFYEYCHPLVFFGGVAMVAGIFDRWLLQRYGGSVEQGFFGLSFKIGDICFLFVSALTPLLLREFSKSFSSNDFERMRKLFSRHIPLLYSITTFISVFIALQGHNLGWIFGGKGFSGAAVSITIMALYPLHRTYGQLSGSVFYATGQTHLFRNIGIAMRLLSLPVTYFLIAPKSSFGFELGSVGLALKFVIMQIIAVNIQLWFNTKFLRLSYSHFLWHQVYSVFMVLLVAKSAISFTDLFFQNPFLNVIISGIIYSVLIGLLVVVVPSILALSRSELKNLLFTEARQVFFR